MLFLLLLIAISAGTFFVILGLNIPGLWKFGLVVVEMIIVTQILVKKYKMESQMGLILLRSQAGLQIIERFAKRKELFNFLADLGNFMCYGALSFLIMRKNTNIKTAAIGAVLLTLIILLVAPNTVAFLSSVIEMQDVGKISEQSQGGVSSIIFSLGIILVYLGGMFLMLVLSIVWYGIIVLIGIYNMVGGTPGTTPPEPGGTFLLPGVNLPLLEGILALVIIMVVHEGAHAIMARIAKNKILSSGIVLFGIIPVGAFVEPDEEELKKLEKVKQSRVLIAGSTSNLMFSLAFFLLFFAFVSGVTALSLHQIEALKPILRFIYITLGLTFSLNFIVGSINLLPLPLFDGFRVMDVNVDNKVVVKALMYVVLAAFIMNFLPWLFKP